MKDIRKIKNAPLILKHMNIVKEKKKVKGQKTGAVTFYQTESFVLSAFYKPISTIVVFNE